MTVESSMARLRGALEAELGKPPEHCPYADSRRRAAWVAGYLIHVVSTLANDRKKLVLFPVKMCGDWSEPEVELLVQGWRSGLPLRVLSGLLGRSPRAVRCRASRAGLGRRLERTKAKAA